MKAVLKELHDQMRDEERGMREDRRHLRDMAGAPARRQIESLAAAFRASYVARKAMRDGCTLATLEAYTEQKTREAEEYPPAAPAIRSELFYIFHNARRYSAAAGEILPPIFQDWSRLAVALDDIAAAFERDGDRAARIHPPDRRGWDLRIDRTAALSRHWLVADLIETHKRESGGANQDTATVMEMALRWYAEHGTHQERRDLAISYLQAIHEERASL